MTDITVTAASVAIQGTGGSLSRVVVGESVVQGQPGYLNTSDNKYYQCDADDTAAKAVCAGIFLTPASTNGYAVLALSGTSVSFGATLTVGQTYVLSGNKGGIAPIADLASLDYVTHLGVASTAAILPLDINVTGVQVP